MKTDNHPLPCTPVSRRECIFTLGAIAASLAGCGGGGSSVAGVSSGGTGSLSAGTVTGFGSVFIHGVKYEDGQATFTDDDGIPRNRDDLKLGMVAVLVGSVNAGIASATSVSFDSELVGPVSTVDLVAKTFVVLEQTIQVTGSTIFESQGPLGLANGLGSVSVNDIVEVHGYARPSGPVHFQATRVQRESPGKSEYRLQGTVSALTPNPTGGTFNLGGLAVAYSSSFPTDLRVAPTDGARVRVRLDAAISGPPWRAKRISTAESAWPDQANAEVEGVITRFVSATDFSVDGIAVDASAIVPPAGLQLGSFVEVTGALRNSILVATGIEIEDSSVIDALEFELIDVFSSLTASTFVIRGVTVNFSAVPVTFLPAPADATRLASHAGRLEVKGRASADGTQINATQITFL